MPYSLGQARDISKTGRNLDLPLPRLPAASGSRVPCHDRTIRVTRCGRICVSRLKVNLATMFAGQLVGIREVEDQVWLVSFLDYDLGFFDKKRGRVELAPNPFVPDRVLTMCPE